MSCLKLPTPPAPDLPFPISLTPPGLPTGPSIDVKACCKLPPVSLPIPPISIPPVILNPAVITAMKGYMAQALTYVNSLALNCPLEG